MPPGRSSRTARAQRAHRIEQVLEHVEQRHRVEAAGLEAARPRARPSRRSRPRAAAELDGRRIQIDADRPPSRRRAPLRRRSRCCSRRRGSAARGAVRCRAISADALAAEPLDAVVVALDAEVAHDVLVLLRRVDLLVVRLVEASGSRRPGRTRVQRTMLHVVLVELVPRRRRCRRSDTARGVSRSSGIRPCTRTSSSIGCVRFSISCL